MLTKGLVVLGTALPVFATSIVKRQTPSIESCPGYTASNVQDTGSKVTANLALAGTACNVYGEDLTDLRLEVEYQTRTYPLLFQNYFKIDSLSNSTNRGPPSCQNLRRR